MSWWGVAFLDIYYACILGETWIDDPWILNVHIYIGNIRVRHFHIPPKETIRMTEEISRNCLGSVNRMNQMTPSWLNKGLFVGFRRWKHNLDKDQTRTGQCSIEWSHKRPVDRHIGRWWCSSMVVCNLCHRTALLKGRMRNSPHRQT